MPTCSANKNKLGQVVAWFFSSNSSQRNTAQECYYARIDSYSFTLLPILLGTALRAIFRLYAQEIPESVSIITGHKLMVVRINCSMNVMVTTVEPVPQFTDYCGLTVPLDKVQCRLSTLIILKVEHIVTSKDCC